MDARSRVCTLIELVDKILSYTSKADNARCARVCSAWAGVALNRVWNDLPPILSLLETLPLGFIDDGSRKSVDLSSIKSLRPDSWDRFNHYASRVKRLSISDLREPLGADLVLNRCPLRPVFPKLRDMFITSENATPETFLSYTRSLLHNDVHYLSIDIEYCDWDAQTVDRVLKEISVCFPGLRTIYGSLNDYRPEFQRSFQDFATSFNGLEKLMVPTYALSPTLFASLGCLYNLRSIRAEPLGETCGIRNVQGFRHIQLEDDMFPSLRTLEMQCFSKDIMLFFERNLSAMHNLRKLSLYKQSGCDVQVLQRLLEALASSRRCMEEIYVINLKSVLDDFTSSETDAITAVTLRPLSRFTNLRRFGLEHAVPVDIADEELSKILSKCPELRLLKLNPMPFCLSQTSLTLNILETLAENNPKLEEIQVYVDATANIDSRKIHHRAFDNLDSLLIDFSPITPSLEISDYLSRILPAPETLYVHETGPNSSLGGVIDSRVERWDDVRGRMAQIKRKRLGKNPINDSGVR